MTIDRELATELATLDVEAASSLLTARGLCDAAGLDELVQTAGRVIRDDPAVGARLAELARHCAHAAESPAVVPRATYLLAQARAGAGDMEGALDLIDEAKAGFVALDLVHEALRTNLGRSQALNEMGRHDEALAACAEILDGIDVTRPDIDAASMGMVAAAHQNSGLCLELSGRFEDALDHYTSATIGYESLGDSRAVAEVTYDRALVLLSVGQHAEALITLQRSAAAFRAQGFRALLVMALANTAEVQLHRGEYQQCLASLAEASDALEGISSPGGEQTRLLVAGRAYLALNLLPEALASFSAATAAMEGTGMVIDRARARWGQGLALARTGRLVDAAAALADAARQFRRSGQSVWLAEVLLDEARLHRTRGELKAAAASVARAFEVSPNGSAAHASATLLRADLSDKADPRVAAEALEEARSLGLAPLTATALHALGRAQLAAGRREEAIETLQSAIDHLEALRGNLGHERVLSRFLDDKLSPYGDLLAALLENDADTDRALDVAEQSKSRTLSDLVSGLVSRHRDEAVDDRLDADLRALYAELFEDEAAADSPRGERLRRRVHDLEAEREIVQLRRSAAAPPAGATAPVVQPALPDGVVHLSYAIVGNDVHAFVITPSGIRLVRQIASVDDVERLIERLHRQWDRFRLGPDLVERHLVQLEHSTITILRELHDALFAPLAQHIRNAGANRLVVIPDVRMNDVPFHVLWSEDGPLLDRYEISYSPSRSMLLHLPPRRAGRVVVAGVADDLAPMVEQEVAVVASQVADAVALTGTDATWEAIDAHLATTAHLHLAGHAMFRPDNPMYSVLKLNDRWLAAADVLRLDLDGITVVLSACDTARGHREGAAEINGFVRGFLGAGAATVVASLWTADDRATTAFMEAFYGESLDSAPAAAVRRAQQHVRERWSHPYYWAPWVVVGSNEPRMATR